MKRSGRRVTGNDTDIHSARRPGCTLDAGVPEKACALGGTERGHSVVLSRAFWPCFGDCLVMSSTIG